MCPLVKIPGTFYCRKGKNKYRKKWTLYSLNGGPYMIERIIIKVGLIFGFIGFPTS
jgi:hypothetical protein